MFSVSGIKTFNVLLVGALLSLSWWHGYTQGSTRATQRSEATLHQLRETFAAQEKQRAEQAAQSLHALQQRFERQVAVAYTSKWNYLARGARINAENRQLKRQIDDVTHGFLDEKVSLMLCPACLLVASCSTTTLPSSCLTPTIQAPPPLP
ncbi:MAG: hypothetical protein ACR5LG_00605 [Sodalis sp. (in: enterobacteria)]|uniref:hypothetical protein n=1 Tax=Sodalis sp. (in: enterobacteria) TaxID=1898979 RepID=UPI003F3093A4